MKFTKNGALGILPIFFDQGPRSQKVQGSKVQVLGGLLRCSVDFASTYCPAQTTNVAVRTLVPAIDEPSARAEATTAEPKTPTAAIAEADVVVSGQRVLTGLAMVLEGNQRSLFRARNRTSPVFRQGGSELFHHLDGTRPSRVLAAWQHPVVWIGDEYLDRICRDPLYLGASSVLEPLTVALEEPRIVLAVELGVELADCLMQ